MSRPATWLALALGLFGGFGLARGQDTALPAPNFDRTASDQYRQWLGTEAALPTKEQEKKSEELAQYLVYRLTDYRWQTQPGSIRNLINEATGWIDDVFDPKKTKNTHLRTTFVAKLVAALEVVLTNPKHKNIELVNAARILEYLTNVGKAEESAGLIAKVLAEPKHNDGTRYWVFRSLRNLFAAAQQKPPVVIKNAADREKCIELLAAHIERPLPITPETPEQEKEGLRMVRREAIRALALVREPVLAGNPKVRPALTLARVVRADKSLTLPPRLDEQVEAAVGLTWMQADPKGDYQPDVAAYHVAAALRDFASAYQNSGGRGREPWKVHASRMDEGLRAMEATFKDNPAVKTVASLGGPVLSNVEAARGNPNAAALNEWVTKNPPNDPALFKGDAASKVTPPEVTGG